MNKLCVVLFLVFCVLLYANDVDQGIIQSLLDALDHSAMRNDQEAMFSYGNHVLSYDPQNSDGLYVTTLILANELANTQKKIKDLEQALIENSWYVFSPHDAHILLAELYYRTRSYSRAITHINNTTTLLREGWFANDRLFEIFIKAQLKLEDHLAATRSLERGLALFPKSTRLKLIKYEIEGISHADILAYWLPQKEETIDLILLGHHLRNVDDDTVFASLYKMYIAGGGSDIDILLKGETADSTLLLKTLSSMSFTYQSIGLITEYADKHPLAYGTMIQELYAYKSIELDSDGDGYSEEQFFLDRTAVVRRIIDKNQDGIPEFDIQYDGGRPTLLRVETEGRRIFFKYEQYPRLSSVQYNKGNEFTLYVLRENTLNMPIVRNPPNIDVELDTELISIPGENPSILEDLSFFNFVTLPTTEEILNHSYLIYSQEKNSVIGRIDQENIFEARYSELTDEILSVSYLENFERQAIAQDFDVDSYFDVITDYLHVFNGQDMHSQPLEQSMALGRMKRFVLISEYIDKEWRKIQR